MRRATLLASIVLGCGSSETTPGDAGVPAEETAIDSAVVVEDSAAPTDSGSDTTPLPCMRTPAPEGAPRKVVVSHPFDSAGKKSGAMEVLDLASDGTLMRSGKTFALTTAAFDSPIVFTPDGEIGMVAEDDGTVGVFKLGAAGPTVVHAGFKGKFYASRVVIDPGGQRAWIVDGNTPENGGGIYAVDIACDGTLTDKGKLVGARTPAALQFLGAARALVAGGPMLGSPETVDAHLLSWKEMPSLIGSTAPFGDRDAIPSWMDVTPDRKLALIADNGIIKGSRVAVFEISDTALKPLQIFTLDNPAAVLASPYDNAALVLNSDGKDGFTLLKRTGPANAPFVNAGKLAYVHGRPALPSVAAMIARGPLKGRVLVAENVAVRSLQFTTDGAVTDLAKLAYPMGLDNVLGTIGVQP